MTPTITSTITKPRTRFHKPRGATAKTQTHPSGTPRPGGRLDRFNAGMDPNNRAIFEDGLAYVSVEGQGPRRAVMGEKDFLRITARDPNGPWLTRSRWWLDDAGMLRAYSLHEKPMEHGVLVAAAVIGAEAGETLDIPGDPLDVRRSQIRRIGAV